MHWNKTLYLVTEAAQQIYTFQEHHHYVWARSSDYTMPSSMGRDRSMAYILSPLWSEFSINGKEHIRSRPMRRDEEEHSQEYKNILARADVGTKTVNDIKR